MNSYWRKIAFVALLFPLLSFVLAVSPAASAATTNQAQAGQNKYCYLLLGAADRAAKRESVHLKEQCYSTSEELEKDNPSLKIRSGQVSLQSTTAVQVRLIDLYTDLFRTGLVYSIDGYSGCGVYYYVNSLPAFIDSQVSSSESYCTRRQAVWSLPALQGGQLYLSPDQILQYPDVNFDNKVRSWEHNV